MGTWWWYIVPLLRDSRHIPLYLKLIYCFNKIKVVFTPSKNNSLHFTREISFLFWQLRREDSVRFSLLFGTSFSSFLYLFMKDDLWGPNFISKKGELLFYFTFINFYNILYTDIMIPSCLVWFGPHFILLIHWFLFYMS